MYWEHCFEANNYLFSIFFYATSRQSGSISLSVKWRRHFFFFKVKLEMPRPKSDIYCSITIIRLFFPACTGNNPTSPWNGGKYISFPSKLNFKCQYVFCYYCKHVYNKTVFLTCTRNNANQPFLGGVGCGFFFPSHLSIIEEVMDKCYLNPISLDCLSHFIFLMAKWIY